MFKGTKLYSILTGSCPVCHQESMYTSKQLYNFNKLQKMHERCSHCGTKYKIEPSFFYGAMYVSYGVGVALAIATFVLLYFFGDFDRLTIFLVIMGVLILSLPIIIRLSRNIWINFFFTYDPDKAEKN